MCTPCLLPNTQLDTSDCCCPGGEGEVPGLSDHFARSYGPRAEYKGFRWPDSDSDSGLQGLEDCFLGVGTGSGTGTGSGIGTGTGSGSGTGDATGEHAAAEDATVEDTPAEDAPGEDAPAGDAAGEDAPGRLRTVPGRGRRTRRFGGRGRGRGTEAEHKLYLAMLQARHAAPGEGAAAPGEGAAAPAPGEGAAPVYMYLTEDSEEDEPGPAQVTADARQPERHTELAAVAAAAEAGAVDQAVAADDLARLTAMNLQLVQLQGVRDARATSAARRFTAVDLLTK